MCVCVSGGARAAAGGGQRGGRGDVPTGHRAAPGERGGLLATLAAQLPGER